MSEKVFKISLCQHQVLNLIYCTIDIQERKDEEFREKLESNKILAEQRTAKKRAKRLKKKQLAKAGGKKTKKQTDDGSQTSSDSDTDSNSETDEKTPASQSGIERDEVAQNVS